MDDNLKKNDPNRAVIESEKSGVRPGFLGGSDEKGAASTENERVGKAAKQAKNSEAADDLRTAEDGATEGGLYRSADGVAETRQGEEDANGFYSGEGRIVDDKKNGKKKGFLRRGGPLFAIIFAVFGVGGLMGGAQMFQPFSLIAQFTESFNSMHTSANLRSGTFFKMQMDSGRTKNPIKGTLFGEDTFKISNRQANKLAAQGIEYDDNYDGSGTRVLKYVDDTGNMKIVAAGDSDVSALRAKGYDAVDFRTEYNDNVDFFTKYNAGSTTWRGAIANWFGSLTDMFIESNNLTRNLFQDFQKKAAANGGDTKATAQELLSQRTGTIEDGGVDVRNADEETDEDGEIMRRAVDASEVTPDKEGGGIGLSDSASSYENGGTSSNTTKGTIERANLNAETVRSKLDAIGGSVQKGANIACTVLNVAGSISLLVTATEALQIINLATAYFETIDKVKAGYGDDTPIHDFTNALNETKEETFVPVGEITGLSGDGEKVEYKNYSQAEYPISNKTAMQSSGVAALYGGGAVNPNDPSVKSFNLTSSINGILGGLGTSVAMFEGCAVAKYASNMTTMVTSAVEVAGCILAAVGAVFTFGASAAGCAPLVGKIIKGIAFSVAISAVIAAVIGVLTPAVIQAMTRDLVSDLGGESLGNALTSGANMYLGSSHRANGGSLSTADKYIEYATANQRVIAENAKYERETLSPFDLTSKYTFMGTIMTQMMSFMTTSSLMDTVTKGGSAVSSSLVAMSPTAMAYNVAEGLPTMEEYEKICPYLASIGAVGDAYCNPYSVTDVSTMGYDPADVINRLDAKGNFSGTKTVHGSDGEVENVVIAGDSELAKYILYCDQRESTFGIADQNIANELGDWATVKSSSSAINTAANAAIGAIPVVGDLIDVVNNEDMLRNIGYISGESCVAGNTVQSDNAFWMVAADSSDWDTGRDFQRFIEDQALAESMGLINESAVTAYLREYYEENPLDNSYEGILARKSGLTKDTVVAILDLVEYGEYIANYHPEERYAFGAPAVEVETELKFDNENVLAGGAILPQRIIYTDVRNRTFVV